MNRELTDKEVDQLFADFEYMEMLLSVKISPLGLKWMSEKLPIPVKDGYYTSTPPPNTRF
jgi:hypothetical protein